MNLYRLDAKQWLFLVQPPEHIQAKIDALVAEHLGEWIPRKSTRAESGKRRAWMHRGVTYNNLAALRALQRRGVTL